MNYKKQHIPIDGTKRQNVKINPNTITIHSTGNEKSTAQNERDNLARKDNTRAASFHIVVDEKEIIECVPLNEKTLHAGNNSGNITSISIEMCESGNREKVIDSTVKLVAKMLHERNWGIDKLRRHYDWSRKICPRIMSANNWKEWDRFKFNVNKELIFLKQGGKVVEDKNKPSDWAKKEWEWAKEMGLLDGKRPKDPITREEFAIVLYRIYKSKELAKIT